MDNLIHADCLDAMAQMDAESIDAIVTDPPYGLGFMGKDWDRTAAMHLPPSAEALDTPLARFRTGKGPSAVAFDGHAFQAWCEAWAREAFRIAKPGAHLLAFGGTRTVHRLAAAIEDAGWEIRDMLVWGYASGFPKSHNLDGEWNGWGTALKPAWEPIVMARKPLRGTVAANVLRHGTGALNIDGTRIGTNGETPTGSGNGTEANRRTRSGGLMPGNGGNVTPDAGRWPSNVILGDEIFEPGVPGVVIGGSLAGTMTAWSSSPDSAPNHIVSPVSNAARRSSRSAPGANGHASATGSAGTQLDAWATSTDIPKPDTGCSDGTTADAAAISGSTARSGRMPTGQSLPVTSSTIETATGSTTTSPTSNASADPSTTPITNPSERGPTEWPDSENSNDESESWRPNSATAEGRNYQSGTRGVPGGFAMQQGRPVEDDGYGYSRFFLIPKSARAEREPVLGGLPLRPHGVHDDDGYRQPGERKANHTAPGPRQNVHPTVKPLDLMRHLVRLVTPPGGTVLDPFLGSGTTALAAEMEGFAWIGVEKEAEYIAITEARLNGTQMGLGLVG